MPLPEPPPRIYLSPPHMCGEELRRVEQVFASNWLAPVGPEVEAFERALERVLDAPHAVALSSGTAALHLALELAGVGPGDEVLCSTLTFVASANPIVYLGAAPVFVDSERESWNIDPQLVARELDAAARRGRLPRALIVVHLYGQAADLDPIVSACARHGVALIEDAAECLGASYRGRAPGNDGLFGVLSFNGNKILTTSGGGALVTADAALAARARKLATQARDPAPHYQHSAIGYNYRLSNVLAAIGCGQLGVLAQRVEQRRANFAYYQKALGELPGLSFHPEAPWGRSTRWLTVLQIDPAAFGATREDLRLALEQENIEARPVWKPLHMQPVFAGARRVGGEVAEQLFEHGLCLPSGSQMTDTDLARVAEIVIRCHRREGRG